MRFQRKTSIKELVSLLNSKETPLLVKSVIPGSGADNMGIKEGDKIVKIGDRGIDDFYSYLDYHKGINRRN